MEDHRQDQPAEVTEARPGWRVTLRKDGSRWVYYRVDPQGRGLAQSLRCSRSRVLSQAIAPIPIGERYELIEDGLRTVKERRGMDTGMWCSHGGGVGHVFDARVGCLMHQGAPRPELEVLLAKVCEVLWPDGVEDAVWNSDTIAAIAELLEPVRQLRAGKLR